MDKTNGTNNTSNNKAERDIEVARIAYIGAAIATVADAIALLGDGIAAYAAKLALDALIEDNEASLASTASTVSSDSESTSGTSSASSTTTSSTSSSTSSSRYKGKLNRAELHSFRKGSNKHNVSNSQLADLQEQIEHYINELIEIKDSINK